MPNSSRIPGVFHGDAYSRVFAGSRGSKPQDVAENLLHPVNALAYIQQAVEQILCGGISPWQHSTHAKLDDFAAQVVEQIGQLIAHAGASTFALMAAMIASLRLVNASMRSSALSLG